MPANIKTLYDVRESKWPSGQCVKFDHANELPFHLLELMSVLYCQW